MTVRRHSGRTTRYLTASIGMLPRLCAVLVEAEDDCSVAFVDGSGRPLPAHSARPEFTEPSLELEAGEARRTRVSEEAAAFTVFRGGVEAFTQTIRLEHVAELRLETDPS